MLILFGLHAVSAIIEKNPQRIKRLLISKDRKDNKLNDLIKLAKSQAIPIETTSNKELDRVAKEANHQGVIAYCEPVQTYTEHDLPQLLGGASPLLLVIDGVQDPHNLGACLRSADAAGVNAVIAPKDKAVGVTATVSKVASGAAETVPFVQVTNLVRALEKLKELGVWIFGADGSAEQSLYQTDLTGPSAIVLGAEGTGLRRLTREHCDMLIKIPMVGSVESLNVSVATGVILFEALRQRIATKSS